MHGMAVVFVQCRSARARVHMQVPLVDVTSDLGPLEINVAGGAGGRRAGGCAVVRGVARRGTALMYRHVQPHRGTAAAAAAAVPRVVLDISYMLPRSVGRHVDMHMRVRARVRVRVRVRVWVWQRVRVQCG